MEYDVIDFVEAEKKILDRIERINKRIKRFNELLDRLPLVEKDYLIAKYEHRQDIREQPYVEEQALSIAKEMEEYKFEISN